MFETAVLSKGVPADGTNDVRKPPAGKISIVVSHSDPDLSPRGARMKGEAADTTLALDGLENIAASAPAIRQQLARILQSTIFIHSERLARFLRFIVEHVIGGNQNHLKEYVIGSEVYDRRPPYHPSQDSIVRTEARRLRGKLKEYYETEGKADPIFVYLRPGSYIPVLRRKEALVGPQSAAENDPLLSAKTAMTIAILPFYDITRSELSSTYARGIPDELAFTLMQIEGCRVISPASMAHFSAQEHDLGAAMSKVGAQIAYEGSVREEANHIRVTATIVDAAGFQLWAKRFDTEPDSQNVFITEEEIASALSVGIEVLFGRFAVRCGS
jgi:TolB-like protein